MTYNTYTNPLTQRYASQSMIYLFSPEYRIKTWRKLWISLAEEEKNLGLDISDNQINELKSFQENINFETAWKIEKQIKHEVMSHIHAYGEQCPNAKKIIHLGATSAYVLDNTDLIQMKEALFLIKEQLVNLIYHLKKFCIEYKDVVTLGYTHYQPAQPTTVGKRASLWLQDLVYDFEDLEFRINHIPFRGVKGTTGSQNSFLKLFEEDKQKVIALDENVTKKMGFSKRAMVTGQTYSRKIDYQILSLLSSIVQSAHKFSNDIRLLQNLGEIDEPFEEDQVGSSAMPYKRNPMRSERIASLARYVINLTQNTSFTASNQWLERTLDDSANKRLSVPEAFLGTNAVLILYQNIINGLKVHKKIINRHLEDELPFMITEDILMECVKRGKDRQEIHEILRKHSIESVKIMKEEGIANPLINKLSDNKEIPLNYQEICELLNKDRFLGLCPQQVDDFISLEVNVILENNKLLINETHSQIVV